MSKAMDGSVFLFRVYDNDDYLGKYRREQALIRKDPVEDAYVIRLSLPNNMEIHYMSDKMDLTPTDLHAEILSRYYKETGKHGMPEM